MSVESGSSPTIASSSKAGPSTSTWHSRFGRSRDDGGREPLQRWIAISLVRNKYIQCPQVSNHLMFFNFVHVDRFAHRRTISARVSGISHVSSLETSISSACQKNFPSPAHSNSCTAPRKHLSSTSSHFTSTTETRFSALRLSTTKKNSFQSSSAHFLFIRRTPANRREGEDSSGGRS